MIKRFKREIATKLALFHRKLQTVQAVCFRNCPALGDYHRMKLLDPL